MQRQPRDLPDSDRVTIGGMPPHRKIRRSDLDHSVSIHLKCCDRRGACRRNSDHTQAILRPDEVFRPYIAPRMKQRDLLARGWVGRSRSVGLVSVAVKAGEREVLLAIRAAGR